MDRRRFARRPTARSLVRAGAAAALAGAVAVPLFRKRARIGRAATTAAAFSGPLALAVLKPRTDRRDIALYAAQMWAFLVVHELPYDDPDRLRARLRIRYPIAIDRAIGLGRLPNARLQALAPADRATIPDRVLTMAHWAWFMQPHLSLLWILRRDPERFPRAARQMAATYDIGCAGYFAVPTAPPWWAAEHGYIDEDISRRMIDVGEAVWGPLWPKLYETLGGNPWAAMPSLHFATSVMAAVHLSESGPIVGTAGWVYAATLGLALVYLGEHYVTDLAAGAGLVWMVRRGEPVVEPFVERVNRGLRALERVANS